MQPINIHIFNSIPFELTLFIISFLSPIDLYHIMLISRGNMNFIMSNLNDIVRIYKTKSTHAVERFLWGQFNNLLTDLYITPQELFSHMIKTYLFAQTTLIEDMWALNSSYKIKIYPSYETAPLPKNEELFLLKLRTGMLYTFFSNHFELPSSYSNQDFYFMTTYSYKLVDMRTFSFLFKFYMKYRENAYEVCMNLDERIILFVERGITFEKFSEQIDEGIILGGTLLDTFEAIAKNKYETYIIHLIDRC